MKALQIQAEGSYSIIEIELPKPMEDQVTVQIEMVSTCPRWDMHMMSGKDMFDTTKKVQYPLLPGFPGHEMVGIVKTAGAKVKMLKVGDRVAALEHLSGIGAYTQYLNYYEYELIKIPQEISLQQAVSFELLKCVLIGLQQFDDITGKSVLVSGLGPAGILALQAARLLGASRVVGVDINLNRVAYIQRLGFGEAMHPEELGDMRFDLGYDCVGASVSVQHVLAHVDEHLVIFGVLKGDVHYAEHLWFKGTKLESYKYRRFNEQDKQLLLDLVVNKGLNTECLQTHHVPFTRYEETIDLLKTQEAIKVYAYPGTDFE